MPKGKELAEKSCIFLGRLYSDMDCQTFVERSLAEIGINMDLGGSNSWLREVMKNGWVGSPEECVKKYGSVPDGAFLFIREFDGKEPEKYRNDGIGNASHIGIETGLTGEQMIKIAEEAGNTEAKNYNFGDGAIHSSSTRKHVATSKFSGKTINGGWNLVGLWDKIDYGETISTGSEDEPNTLFVWAESGDTVNIRASKNKQSKLVNRVSVGETVTVVKTEGKWTRIIYTDKRNKVWGGWIMSEFLTPNDPNNVTLHIPSLSRSQAKELMKIYPGSWIE